MSIKEEIAEGWACIETRGQTDLVIDTAVSLQNNFPPVDLFRTVLVHQIQKTLLWSSGQASVLLVLHQR